MHINGKILDISIFIRLENFVRSIYFGDISVRQPINRQDEMKRLLRDLEYYKPKKIQGNISEGGNLIVIAYEKSIFPLLKETPTWRIDISTGRMDRKRRRIYSAGRKIKNYYSKRKEYKQWIVHRIP